MNLDSRHAVTIDEWENQVLADQKEFKVPQELTRPRSSRRSLPGAGCSQRRRKTRTSKRSTLYRWSTRCRRRRCCTFRSLLRSVRKGCGSGRPGVEGEVLRLSCRRRYYFVMQQVVDWSQVACELCFTCAGKIAERTNQRLPRQSKSNNQNRQFNSPPLLQTWIRSCNILHP